MKPIAAISSALVALAASPAALAHTGHVVESGGHSHWLGWVALALAAPLAARLALHFAAQWARRRAAARNRNG
jgi:hypothetical protein